MTAHVELHGHLCRTPERTSNIRPMVSSLLVVQLGRGEDVPEWFALAAFSRLGEALAKHAKGDMLAIAGRLTKTQWTGKDGVERSGFSILVDHVVSARTAATPAARPDRQREAVPFGDAIPF